MNYIKRALLSITHKKGRSLLLILVLGAILLFVLAGILIQSAAKTAVKEAKSQSGTTVTLQADRQKAFEQLSKDTSQTQTGEKPKLDLANVSVKTAKKLAQSQYVKSYNFSNMTQVSAKSFDPIETSSDSVMQQRPGSQTQDSSQVTLSGSLNLELTNGKLLKGRSLTSSDQDTNNVVIEKQLAKQNDLSVGDTLKVTADDQTYKLKVVGIYQSNETQSMGMNDPANTLYTSYTLVGKISGTENKVQNVVYTLSDPTKAQTFIKASKKLINTNKFALTADDSTYQALKTPLNNVKSFATKIVWLVCIAGTIILTLLIVLMMRERRYEIGVLLSLGEKKGKIVTQFFVEMFVLTIIALSLAGIGGKFVANALGDQLLSQQTTQVQETAQSSQGSQMQKPGGQAPSGQAPTRQGGGRGGFGQSRPTSTQLESLAIKVDVASMLKLGAVSLALVLLSIILGTVGILRMQPKKILIG